MNDKATIEVIAPTVEEALAQGLAELGLPAEAVSMEVLDAGSKGFLGLGGRQVRVRLSIKGPDDKPASVKKEKPAPKQKDKPKPTPKAEIKSEGSQDPTAKLVEETIVTLLDKMKVKANVSANRVDSDDDRRVVEVDIHGNDLGVLIGRRAETLNALQYITALIVGKQMEQWVQVVVDVEGYRNRREHQLRQMARRMAEQVVRTGRQQALEPMTASERRIVHIELRNNPNVDTVSVGEGSARKVTIVPKQ